MESNISQYLTLHTNLKINYFNVNIIRMICGEKHHVFQELHHI